MAAFGKLSFAWADNNEIFPIVNIDIMNSIAILFLNFFFIYFTIPFILQKVKLIQSQGELLFFSYIFYSTPQILT